MSLIMKEKVIFLAGPTAAGKSEAAVYLAQKTRGEIISCDSMQVYKGMEIISSQPADRLKKKIPHHLIGIVSPEKEYNASKYRDQALKKVREIISKDKLPIFAGGTGLYMSVVIDGIFKLKSEDRLIRQKLYREAERSGSHQLYHRLKKIDPEAALKIHPNDLRRIVRALEVFEVTGKQISLLQRRRKGMIDKYEVKIFCLRMQRDELNQRIEERIKEMFKNGLLDEVKELLKLKLSRTAGLAIGFRELKGYLNGEYDFQEARRQMIHNTQSYAKRQMTWFRKDKRIKWIDIKNGQKAQEAAQKIWRELY